MTRAHRLARIIALAPAALLAGCAANVAWYQPPAAAPDAASLVGSKVERPALIVDQRAYIVAIDGAPVKGQVGAWSNPVPIAPGLHTVQLGFSQGNDQGQVPIKLDLPAGARYVARLERKPGDFADLWVEDQTTGQPVTERYVVPIVSTGSTYIPIFVPVRGK